jgi:hypothetical protein
MKRFVLLAVAGGALLSSTAAVGQSPDGTIATGISFEMEAVLAPVVEKYAHCVNDHRPMVINGTPTLSQATETGIAACKAARSSAMAEADAILAAKPGWESKSKRDGEITSDFDNTDASARKLARDTDAYFGRTSR